MSKATIALATSLGAFSLAIASIALLGLATGVSAQPLYRLDARYHNLPPELVSQLLAHPPTRSWVEPRTRCQILEDASNRSGYARPTGYCICFGAEACASAPEMHAANENWRCTAPLGAVDDKWTAVCRAELRSITVIGG